MDISKSPFSLVFGSEKNDISEDAKEMTDGYLTSPMVGFTESLNISVAAAIMLQHFTFFIRTRKHICLAITAKISRTVIAGVKAKNYERVDLIEGTFLKNQHLK